MTAVSSGTALAEASVVVYFQKLAPFRTKFPGAFLDGSCCNASKSRGDLQSWCSCDFDRRERSLIVRH
jgi:hypothetical protein